MKMFPYQEDAFNSIKDHEYAAIFHEQGLGKSKIAIDLILYWVQKEILDTVLLVAKKMLLHNWENEIRQHSHLNPRILTQNLKSNYYIFNSPCRVILANYEMLIKEQSRIALLLDTRDIGIILDESAKIKNPSSSLTKYFLEISQNFKRRIIMTGTPVANRPYDIWSQVNFLDGGKSLGKDFKTFKKNTDLTSELSNDEDARVDFENKISEVFHKISGFTVRETKNSNIIDLPSKKYITKIAEWEPHQRDLYDTIRKEMKALVVKNGVPVEDISDGILKRLLRLIQVASNPTLIDQNYRAEPGKLATLIEIIETIIRNGEKSIIWTNFVENVIWLSKELYNFGTCAVHGKMSMEKRNHSLDLFKDDPATQILVATPASAKEGLTLTSANNVIFFDRSFSLDDYLQAQDRIHRISQTKQCNIYTIIMPDSIDLWVDSLLEAKKMAAQLTQGDITISEYQENIDYDFNELLSEILK
jgi:SNF2 family DNA or RNA helicase